MANDFGDGRQRVLAHVERLERGHALEARGQLGDLVVRSDQLDQLFTTALAHVHRPSFDLVLVRSRSVPGPVRPSHPGETSADYC